MAVSVSETTRRNFFLFIAPSNLGVSKNAEIITSLFYYKVYIVQTIRLQNGIFCQLFFGYGGWIRFVIR